MPFLMTRVPLQPAERVVDVGRLGVRFLPFQPVVWVRLVPWVGPPSAGSVPFPVVIDTGNNDVALVSESRLRAWAGADPAPQMLRHQRIVNGYRMGSYGFNLDLLSRSAHGPGDRVLVRLQTEQGVTVIPTEFEGRFPPTALIGVRCLTANRLTFSLNGDRRTFSLRRPPLPAVRLSPPGR